MSKIFTMYNNKGGVSKTTTLFNLGVYLAQNRFRVLFVDCDPQCNLTELFFASSPELQEPEKELPGTSIYKALLPRFKGETGRVDPSSVILNESTIYDKLFLFRGDIEFSLAEIYLGTAWNQAVTENIHEKNTYVAFYRLLQDLLKEKGFDYILCDIGPSTGAISRTVVLSCDGIFVPLFPDRFCYQAVRLLGKIIHEWMSRHKEISKNLVPFGIETFPGTPLFYGAVIQNFKIHSAAKAKQSYVKWQDKISEAIKESLVCDKGLDKTKDLNLANPYLATIRDVGPLAPTAQMFGRAIFDVQQEHTKEASTTGQMYYGTVWQPWEDRMKEYKEEIQKIAEAM
jgi:cellulose biosynthesis protein BcsQ